MNASLAIPHPGYKIENMHRSATGATQFRPEVIKEFLEQGAEINFELERAEQIGTSRKEALRPLLEKYQITSDRAGEVRAVAHFFGPNTDWPQNIITMVPWSVLTHLSRYKMDNILRRQIMELIVHYFEHPGCPNGFQPRYDRVMAIVDNSPIEIVERHDNLIREQRQEDIPMTVQESPLAQPDAFSSAIKAQIQTALEQALSDLQQTVLAEKKELEVLLEAANGATHDLQARLQAEEMRSRTLSTELEHTRELLHAANIEVATKQTEIDSLFSEKLRLTTALDNTHTKLGIMERAIADVIVLFRRANVVLSDISTLQGVAALLALEYEQATSGGANGHANGYIALRESDVG